MGSEEGRGWARGLGYGLGVMISCAFLMLVRRRGLLLMSLYSVWL
jgi:hypothetical protein